MKHKKTKSRLTRVDLDAVLKLQKEHTELEQRINRLVEYAKARQEGHIAYFVKGDDVIDFVAAIIDEMADKITKLEETIKNEQTDNFQSQDAQ